MKHLRWSILEIKNIFYIINLPNSIEIIMLFKDKCLPILTYVVTLDVSNKSK